MYQEFVDRINSENNWRPHALQFADWLEERGDPIGAALREIVAEGKNPSVLRPLHRLSIYDFPDGFFDWWGYSSKEETVDAPNPGQKIHPSSRIPDGKVLSYFKHHGRYASRWEALEDYIRVVKFHDDRSRSDKNGVRLVS